MRAVIIVAVLFVCVSGCDKGRESVVIGVGAGESALRHIGIAEQLLAERGESGISFAYDSGGSMDDPETEANRAASLVEIEHLVGVVGHGGSRGSLIAAPMYNEAEVVQIVPTGTSRRLHDAGEWTFTLAPDDSVEGAAIARFAAQELDAQRVLVFFLTDEYGYGLRDGVVGELERLGVTLLDEVPIPPRYQMVRREEQEVLSNLARAALDRGLPDAVILAVRDHSAVPLIDIMRDVHPDMRFLAGDGVLLSDSIRAAVDFDLSQVYLTVFWDPTSLDSESRSFSERFRALNGRRPTHSEALFHDAVMLLTTAVREGGADRGAVRDYVISLGVTREPYAGVTGPISFLAERSHPIHIIRADKVVEN
jgi:branched-chain amino acid transport system substrate-binding protein